MRREFVKLFGLSILSFLLIPYKFLYSATKKIINQNLTDEQKNILFNEGTERPFSSSLLHEKRDGFGVKRTEYHCATCGAHHGHVFEDGPGESGKRFCNNGLCLIFKPIN